MGLKSKLSFEILTSAGAHNDDSGAMIAGLDSHLNDDGKPNRRKRKQKKLRKKKSTLNSSSIDPITENDRLFDAETESTSCSYAQSATSSTVCQVLHGELRKRSVVNGGLPSEESPSSLRPVENGNDDKAHSRTNVSVEPSRKLDTAESLDWKQLMAEDPSYSLPMESSPLKYFMEEMYSGNSLRSTTTIGNEKERERVYDTIFRLPWRCELLIDVGFYVCLNSFLSLLTIMPMRAIMTLWTLFSKRQLKKLSTEELSDFGCLVVLAGGVILLGRTDISLIYHMIRGQGTIKLYVVYNVLEVFDKLWQSFGGDVFETLFSSAEGLASCSPESSGYWIQRYTIDLVLAAVASITHSFILLAQAITLSTCIVAHNNALLALLVSNNFAEIKSNVFKRFSKDNVQRIVYSDSVERFHITAFVLFVLAQNIVEAEGPWFRSFLSNALLVYFSEMAIDIIKHSFIAKFNDIKPIAYSEFLEDLCKQTLNIQTDGTAKNLTFVPLAPACVVIRVLSPVYSARLPQCPPWRFFWIIFLSALTFLMLVSLKLMIGMGLQKHAAWYIKRCQRRKFHSD